MCVFLFVCVRARARGGNGGSVGTVNTTALLIIVKEALFGGARQHSPRVRVLAQPAPPALTQ